MNNKVFLKALVHPSEPATRDSGVDLCEKWIAFGNHSKMDYSAVWKALYYCMWHSDKPLVQHALARKLSKMQFICTDTKQWYYLMATFWETICREWPGMDFHRSDKFLALLRYFFHDTLKNLQSKELSKEELKEFIKILENGPLNPKTPKGIIFHIMDIFWEEFKKVFGANFLERTDLVFPMLNPVFILMAQTEEATSIRVGNLFTVLIKDYIKLASAEMKIKILEYITDQLLKKASESKTQDEQREILYNFRIKIYKTLYKLKNDTSTKHNPVTKKPKVNSTEVEEALFKEKNE